MDTKERILHMVLFEVFALILMTLIAVLVTDYEIKQMSGLAIGLSLIAMFWNYFFNLIFDRFYANDRSTRGLKLRIAHGLLFELGMVLVSFPAIMWVLDMDFLSVLILDIGAVMFFFLYAIAFNWIYDILRGPLKTQKSGGVTLDSPVS